MTEKDLSLAKGFASVVWTSPVVRNDPLISEPPLKPFTGYSRSEFKWFYDDHELA